MGMAGVAAAGVTRFAVLTSPTFRNPTNLHQIRMEKAGTPTPDVIESGNGALKCGIPKLTSASPRNETKREETAGLLRQSSIQQDYPEKRRNLRICRQDSYNMILADRQLLLDVTLKSGTMGYFSAAMISIPVGYLMNRLHNGLLKRT